MAENRFTKYNFHKVIKQMKLSIAIIIELTSALLLKEKH